MIARPVKVSVIIPVYNVEKYLSTCLNSCLNQTLYDIELICVNDGSTDRSMEILEEYAKRDCRIRIINKLNGGLSSARNAGLKRACGETVMFLDSDDYLEERACERVWCEMLEAPTDVVIFGTNVFPQNPKPTNWLNHVLRVRNHRYSEFSAPVLFEEKCAKPFVWRQAFRKEILDKHELLFDERVKFGEDMVFQLETFPHAKNFAFIEDRLYNYRWYREGSLMRSMSDDLDDKIDKHFGFVRIISEYWKTQGWFELYGKEYLEWLLEFLAADIRREEVKKKDEYISRLKEIIDDYDLVQYMNCVKTRLQPLAKTLNRNVNGAA